MMISIEIPKEWNEQKKEMCMTWRGIIQEGLKAHALTVSYNTLLREYDELRDRHQRMAKLLENAIQGRSD